MRWVAVLFVAVGPAALAAAPEDWSQFRGPRTDGIARGRQLPVTWSATDNIVWKAELPGLGWSQPVVAKNRVFVTTAISENEPKNRELDWSPGASGLSLLFASAGQKVNFPPPDVKYEWKLFCLDADTGKRLWERTAATGKPKFRLVRDDRPVRLRPRWRAAVVEGPRRSADSARLGDWKLTGDA